MGNHVVIGEHIWDVYKELLFQLQGLDEAVEYITEWEEHLACVNSGGNTMDLISGKELEGGIDETDSDDEVHIVELDALEDGDDFELEVHFTDEEQVDEDAIDEW
ncbi:hypothetical protein CVT25_007076 [Psilocybe cyanescens]|uniref:Uncharacterized protein n=1 Tax=Psilocybe cyanescens TaxID=93625 RepID=A0A409WVN1_PSICY|nr:hypothetical protein CVT25_007076 [Psilocybe cyanescens]